MESVWMADWIDVFIGLRFSLWPGWVLAAPIILYYIVQRQRCQREYRRYILEAGSRIMLRRLQDYETLASPDNGQQTTEGRLPAQGSLLVAQSLSILSIPSVPSLPFRLLSFAFRRQTAKHKRSLPTSLWLRQSTSLQVNETTSRAAAGGLRRNYGTTDRASRLIAHCSQLSAHGFLYPLYFLYLSILSIPFCPAQPQYCHSLRNSLMLY